MKMPKKWGGAMTFISGELSKKHPIFVGVGSTLLGVNIVGGAWESKDCLFLSL